MSGEFICKGNNPQVSTQSVFFIQKVKAPASKQVLASPFGVRAHSVIRAIQSSLEDRLRFIGLNVKGASIFDNGVSQFGKAFNDQGSTALKHPA